MPVAALMRAPSRARLKTEFALFYLLAPVLVATMLPADVMFPALFALTLVGLVLLQATDGFHWRDLRPRQLLDWRLATGFALATLAVCLAVVLTFAPDSAFGLVQENPALMLMIAVLYPVLSALPQEVVYRPLFFRRYGGILPDTRPAIALNAAVFSLAHLMYWNWVVAGMTFAGGIVFAWAYEIRRSFGLAVALHSIGGVVVFFTGLGIYFYSGNVQRPF